VAGICLGTLRFISAGRSGSRGSLLAGLERVEEVGIGSVADEARFCVAVVILNDASLSLGRR